MGTYRVFFKFDTLLRRGPTQFQVFLIQIPMILGFNDWDRFCKFFSFYINRNNQKWWFSHEIFIINPFFMNFPFWRPSGGSMNFDFFKKLTIFKPLWSSLIKDPPLSLGESYGVAFWVEMETSATEHFHSFHNSLI